MNMNSNIKEFVYVLLFIFTTILVNYTGLTYVSTFHRLTIRILSLHSIQSTGTVPGEQLFFCELTRNCAVIIEVKKKKSYEISIDETIPLFVSCKSAGLPFILLP